MYITDIFTEILGTDDIKFHTKWRRKLAWQIAEELDMDNFGVKGMYLFGSVAEECAGFASDIDILVHVDNSVYQMKKLENWFDMWEKKICGEFERALGYSPCYVLDVHYVDDDDIRMRDSFAVKINSLHDRTECLKTAIYK